MIRSAADKYSLLAIAMLALSIATTNCNKSNTTETESVGTIGLALTIPPGVMINSVSYEITGNGITPITGAVNVSEPGATISLLVGGIPAGAGYTIKLNAASTNNARVCAGKATFGIVAGSTTAVTVAMQCTAYYDGDVLAVNVTTNNCPVIDAYSVSPLEVGIGGTIHLQASASDLDPGSTLAFAWSTNGPNGPSSFSNPTAPTTTFQCSPFPIDLGQTITLTVTDGQCPATANFTVFCNRAPGGTPESPQDSGVSTGADGAVPGSGPSCLRELRSDCPTTDGCHSMTPERICFQSGVQAELTGTRGCFEEGASGQARVTRPNGSVCYVVETTVSPRGHACEQVTYTWKDPSGKTVATAETSSGAGTRISVSCTLTGEVWSCGPADCPSPSFLDLPASCAAGPCP